MELLNIECLGKSLRLESSLAGWQQLFWDNTLVAEQAASATRGEGAGSLQFELHSATHSAETPSSIQIRLETQLQWQPFSLQYRLLIDGAEVQQGQRDTHDIERQTPVIAPIVPSKFSLLGIGALALKLLKSAKMIKVALAGASVAAYSWLFSFQFALALLACLVFHEYGHIRAMKYFGMKTKGIYLIPFMGGLAMSDEKINTRWQDVVISIMGPTFGLLLSIAALLAYWLTGNVFFAGLATFNALLNLFNLLPILPLDGGHILKSISFSMHSKVGLIACIVGAALGVFISYTLGLALLGFLLLIGSLEIIFEWRSRLTTHLLPLDRYGQIVSAAWYLLTVGALIGIMWYFAGKGDEMLRLPLKILQS
ncbi:site-2 protease family protein [Deefgea tanakiae]|uniref:Site-2 protease family protein n=1 Tax=Deefgea tanakiae TaxID=2865840 RepID=A0ABX8Z8V9_9NEIS|nr:site-2 protease family protein [Deefgea tanakiae]QZA77759.1 site-2 protease family protein [Deefgea tanakiae]